ncbi:MAG: PhnD/SsuA/transferrin family substrate-binding protein [Clostridia bacterium]|nr:PhnD/SsuA/transferrin family substrate-binding protein [Clostridia bacterium]
MKRTLMFAMALLMLTASLVGCAGQEAEIERKVNVAALAGPTGMGLAYMMEERAEDYEFQILTAPDQINGKFISGEVDIAAVPINLAAVLYQRTEGEAVVIAVNTLGVLYVLENGDGVTGLSDLAGSTLYCTGQGSTPEYTIRYILEENGLAEQVELSFEAEHSALATQLAEGTVSVGMLPEPHVSSTLVRNSETRIAIDINQEWNKLTGTDLVQGCFIVRREFLEQYPGAVEDFLADASESAAKLLSEDGAAQVVVAQGIVGSEAIAERAIPNCNVVCITGEQMKTMMSTMLNILYEFNAQSIGGSLPNEDFYYLGG